MKRTSMPILDSIIKDKPIIPEKIKQIQVASDQDGGILLAMKFCLYGWPERYRDIPECARILQCEIRTVSVQRNAGLWQLHRGARKVTPSTLEKIHEGQQGIHKCKERARMTVWWPAVGQGIVSMIATCTFCHRNKPTQRWEPLNPTPLLTVASRLCQQIGADLCENESEKYLVVVDYYSRYVEIAHFTKSTSQHVIGKMDMLDHHGILKTIVSDNGLQFNSAEFKDFSTEYGFHIQTTSPSFPHAKGQVEGEVQTAKNMLKQEDPILALMVYRATAVTPTGINPCKLFMGREIGARSSKEAFGTRGRQEG